MFSIRTIEQCPVGQAREEIASLNMQSAHATAIKPTIENSPQAPNTVCMSNPSHQSHFTRKGQAPLRHDQGSIIRHLKIEIEMRRTRGSKSPRWTRTRGSSHSTTSASSSRTSPTRTSSTSTTPSCCPSASSSSLPCPTRPRSACSRTCERCVRK